MSPRKAATAQRKADAVPKVSGVQELMAHAYALEIEASERYGEFAAAMEAHNNREVGDLFRKLARVEHRHAEQILEQMGWLQPPPPPAGGWKWESPEGPETGDITDLHYLMQPYHALQIALHNEKRAHVFFERLMLAAPTAAARTAAAELVEEELMHVRLIEEWLARTPEPAPGWDEDPDPPRYTE